MASRTLPEPEKATQCKWGAPSCRNLTTQRRQHEFPVRPLPEDSSAFRKFPLTRGSRTILPLHDTAVDDHRTGPHGVEDKLPAKLGEIVNLYDRGLYSEAKHSSASSRCCLSRTLGACAGLIPLPSLSLFAILSMRSTGLGILPIGSVGIVIVADLAILYRVAQSIIDLFGVHNNRPSNFPFSSRNDSSRTFPSEYVLPGSGRSCGTCQLPSPRVSRSLLIQSGRRSGDILTGLCVDCGRQGPNECVYPLPC